MNKKNNNGMLKNTLYYILVLLAMAGILIFFVGNGSSQSPSIDYSKFTEQLEDGKIKSFSVQPANGVYKISGKYKDEQTVSNNSGLSILGSTSTKSKSFTTIVLPNDSTLSEITSLAATHNVDTTIKEESSSGVWISF